MNSVGKDCNELKKAYDECFNNWFSEKFLKGYARDECAPVFQVYQNCVKEAIKQEKIDLNEIDKDVLGTKYEQKPPSKEKS
ncbi:Uncharacterised protein g2955 [Pycnogonum litorale]